jgi:hypothetical protein
MVELNVQKNDFYCYKYMEHNSEKCTLKKCKWLSQLAVALEIFTVPQELEVILRRNIDTNKVVIR